MCVCVCLSFPLNPVVYSLPLPPTRSRLSPAGHRPVCAWPRLPDAIVSMLKWLLLGLNSNGDCWLTPTHLCTLMLLVLSAAFVPSNQECGVHKEERFNHQPVKEALIALCSPVRVLLTDPKESSILCGVVHFKPKGQMVSSFFFLVSHNVPYSSSSVSSSVSAVRSRCSVVCSGSQRWWKTTGSGRSCRVDSQRPVRDEGPQWDEGAGEWTLSFF